MSGQAISCPRCGLPIGCYEALGVLRFDWHDDPALSEPYNLCGASGDVCAERLDPLALYETFLGVIASCIRAHRGDLEAMGWRVHEIPGHGHGLCMQPEVAVPPVRRFLDEAVR